MKKTDKQEILEAIQGLGQQIDGVDQRLSAKIDGLDQKIDNVELTLTEQIGTMANVVQGIDIRLKRVESQMVTKEYLDIKLADQYTKIIDHVRHKVPEWVKP